MSIRHLKWVLPVGLLVLVFSCKKTMTPVHQGLYADPKSLFSLISNNFNLSHCDTALLLTGLDSVLADKGSYTIFVVQDGNYPTDGHLVNGNVTYPNGGNFYGKSIQPPQNGQQGLVNYYYWFVQLGNIPYLKRVVSYHILPQTLHIADIPWGYNKGYVTLAGDSVYISKYLDANSPGGDTIVTVNGTPIIRSDFQASNGVYHVLNQLLFPEPNTSTWAILSGNNALGWAFEPTPNTNLCRYCNVSNPADTFGFALPAYNYGTFTTALVRTGLDKLLQGTDPYTVMTVPDQYFYNPYNPSRPVLTQEDILTMNLDTLTAIMKLHILPGRYFLSDFQSYAYNGRVEDTVNLSPYPQGIYSQPLVFPTIGPDSLYVIPSGVQPASSTVGFYLFGQGNLLYSPYMSTLQNGFAATGLVTGLQYYPYGFLYTNYLLPQDVVAPNGVIQYLYNSELVPR